MQPTDLSHDEQIRLTALDQAVKLTQTFAETVRNSTAAIRVAIRFEAFLRGEEGVRREVR